MRRLMTRDAGRADLAGVSRFCRRNFEKIQRENAPAARLSLSLSETRARGNGERDLARCLFLYKIYKRAQRLQRGQLARWSSQIPSRFLLGVLCSRNVGRFIGYGRLTMDGYPGADTFLITPSARIPATTRVFRPATFLRMIGCII